jgi:hypothetical protein
VLRRAAPAARRLDLEQLGLLRIADAEASQSEEEEALAVQGRPGLSQATPRKRAEITVI